MSNLFNAMQTKDSLTENGAITNSTTLNNVLDLFFICGACRKLSEEEIEIKLQKAWVEDKLQTLKLIFFASDIREGLGERRFTKIALKWLEKNYKETLEKVIYLVPEYNRWDSLFHLDSEKVLDRVHFELTRQERSCNKDKQQLEEMSIGLLAKWMPRRYNKEFEKFRIAFQKKYKLNDAAYRKLIAKTSKTVEQQMSAKEWDKINYEHVPSVASNKYRKAFYKHDEVRYKEYIEAVTKGEKKINASAIFPYDIYRAIRRGDNEQAIVAQWNSLPNYLEGINEKILPVCDVSGSMDSTDGLPLAISISFGIYFSERNNSIFKDGFITFSKQPKLQILKGNFIEKVRQFDRGFAENTNMISVFELILNKAKDNNLKQDDMPTTILVFSDMEFDSCCENNSKTNYEKIKNLYEFSGYEFPKLVFWNISSSSSNKSNFPIQKDDRAILVSGSTPSVIKSILHSKCDPIEVMNTTLNSERYSILNSII